MQKSAHPSSNTHRNRPMSPALREDKGQKFEPYWSGAIYTERHNLALVRKADQKR